MALNFWYLAAQISKSNMVKNRHVDSLTKRVKISNKDKFVESMERKRFALQRQNVGMLNGTEQ